MTGEQVASDGGGILLKEVDDRFRFLERFAACFTDHRDRELIEHPLVDLMKQGAFGLCLGDEDLIDHDTLRHDALLALVRPAEIDEVFGTVKHVARMVAEIRRAWPGVPRRCATPRNSIANRHRSSHLRRPTTHPVRPHAAKSLLQR